MTLPPFHARNETDRAEMKAYLIARLYEHDPYYDLDQPGAYEAQAILSRDAYATLSRDDPYPAAKRAARKGNLRPLSELLSHVLDDPEIVAFLAVPPRGRGKRKNDRRRQLSLLIRSSETLVVQMVRRIRQIWREDFGRVNRDSQYDESAEKIAGSVSGLSEKAVLQIMKKARPA
jgi:hypothetical protein